MLEAQAGNIEETARVAEIEASEERSEFLCGRVISHLKGIFGSKYDLIEGNGLRGSLEKLTSQVHDYRLGNEIEGFKEYKDGMIETIKPYLRKKPEIVKPE